MSMGSRLTRGKDGGLLLDGKPHVISLDTGDETPVKVDERFDVDLNKLVANEMARQELAKVPGSGDYSDLTELPPSYPEAVRSLVAVQASLRSRGVEVISLEELNRMNMEALARLRMEDMAKAQASTRDSNAGRAGSEPSDGSGGKPPSSSLGADSGSSKA